MRKLVFATQNEHKLKELQQLIGQSTFELVSLKDIGCLEDIPETGPTLESNAAQKAFYIWDRYGLDCFADDTGLEIEALNNEPGVLSARYAGEARDAQANMAKVLQKMAHEGDRKARFRCVISLILNGKEEQFEGVVEGVILRDKQGGSGFGYDPIFKPNEHHASFAAMSEAEKNRISHRGRAVEKLVHYLHNLNP